jgi:hypothetical protein
MATDWRKITLIPLYKNKGNVTDCTNYRGIKLISHTMKFWGTVIEYRLQGIIKISSNQYDFMPGGSTMKVIHLLRHINKYHRDIKKDLHMVFIDLETAY